MIGMPLFISKEKQARMAYDQHLSECESCRKDLQKSYDDMRKLSVDTAKFFLDAIETVGFSSALIAVCDGIGKVLGLQGSMPDNGTFRRMFKIMRISARDSASAAIKKKAKGDADA